MAVPSGVLVGQGGVSIRDVVGAMTRVADLVGAEGVGRSAALTETARHLGSPRFHVFVAGRSKAGKSTLLNALVGQDVMPRDVVPVTLAVASLEWAETAQCRVVLRSPPGGDGAVTVRPDADSLRPFLSEADNPLNARGVLEVAVHLPSPFLRCGVTLFDTPGIGSVHPLHDMVTHDALLTADAVVLVYRASAGFQALEMGFLHELHEMAGHVFVVQNDDIEDDHACQRVVAETRQALSGIETVFDVVRVNALRSLEAQLASDPPDSATAGIEALRGIVETHCTAFALPTKMLAGLRRCGSALTEARARVKFVLDEAQKSRAEIDLRVSALRKQLDQARSAAGQLRDAFHETFDKLDDALERDVARARAEFVATIEREVTARTLQASLRDRLDHVDVQVEEQLAKLLADARRRARTSFTQMQTEVRRAAHAQDAQLSRITSVDFPAEADRALQGEFATSVDVQVETEWWREIASVALGVLRASGWVVRGLMRVAAKIIPGKADDALVELLARWINEGLATLESKVRGLDEVARQVREQATRALDEGLGRLAAQCGAGLREKMQRLFEAEVDQVLVERVSRLNDEMESLARNAEQGRTDSTLADARGRLDALVGAHAEVSQMVDRVHSLLPAAGGQR